MATPIAHHSTTPSQWRAGLVAPGWWAWASEVMSVVTVVRRGDHERERLPLSSGEPRLAEHDGAVQPEVGAQRMLVEAMAAWP